MPLVEVYDPALPADTDQSAQGDDRIRELKRALTERLNRVWPNWPNGDPLTWTNGIIPSAAMTFAVGGVPAVSLPAKSVTQALIALLSIGTPELIDLSVTAAKIAAGAVGDAQLGAFAGSHINDASIPGVKLVDASIGSSKYALLSVLTGIIADGAVTTPKLADASVSNAKVIDATLEIAKLSATARGLISVSKFVDVAVALTTIATHTTLTLGGVALAGVAQNDKVEPAYPDEWLAIADGTQRKLLTLKAVADANTVYLIISNTNDGPLDFPAAAVRCWVTKRAVDWGL